MKQIDHYLAKHILLGVLLVNFVIVGIELILTTFEVFDFENTKVDFWTPFLQVVLRSLPYRIYDYFPTLVFLGALLGMGQLATHHEFIAMQVAGISTSRILLAALKTASLLIVFIFIWGEIVAPKAERYALNQALTQSGLTKTFGTTTGIWLREKNAFIHIQNFSKHELIGIQEFVLDKNFRLTAIHRIDRAEYLEKHWKLQHTKSTLFTPEGYAKQSEQVDTIRSGWLNPTILEMLAHEPKTMTIIELWRYIQYLEANHLDTTLFSQVLWQKIGSPFTIVIMMCLAIPLLLGPIKQKSLGIRMLVGIFLGFVYLALYQTLATTAQVYHIPPILSMILPNLLFLGIAVVLQHKN